MSSLPTSMYRSDSYRTSSNIPMSLSTTSSTSNIHDQYLQSSLPSRREINYRTRDYDIITSMDYRPSESLDRYNDDDDNKYRSLYTHRDHLSLKRSRSDFNEIQSKRLMRR